MSREVIHDGVGWLIVRFPYDRRLVDLVKGLPARRWNPLDKHWAVPEPGVVELVELLRTERFRFDAATIDSYRAHGGTAELESSPEPASDNLTVSLLNERVRDVLEQAFPSPIWLVGEISGFNRNRHKKHVGFQLVEPDGHGGIVASVDATLFERSRADVERALAAAGDPFRIEDEVTVRLRARVELYVPWGSYRIIVEELDINYTLGEAARRREEIVRRLTEEGLVGRNTSLPLAQLPLRVALITSLGSDAYNDVLRTLEESGFAFRVTAHGARVQGRSCEPSVLNALDALRASAGEFDVAIVCRGGGSRTDLAWFDSLALGRAVAEFPVPVLVGIGHEQDHSVLDAVGWRHKTPTAAAAFLVDRVRAALDRAESLGRESAAAAARMLTGERRRSGDRGRRLALAVRASLRAAGERLAGWSRGLPRASSVLLARRSAALDATCRSVSQGARRDVTAAQARIEQLRESIGPRAHRRIADARERTDRRERRARLIDPRRVIERGYAILRSGPGGIVTRAADAPAGARLTAELREGRLALVSEGGIERDDGQANES